MGDGASWDMGSSGSWKAQDALEMAKVPEIQEKLKISEISGLIHFLLRIM
jgi:hypothetical protein